MSLIIPRHFSSSTKFIVFPYRYWLIFFSFWPAKVVQAEHKTKDFILFLLKCSLPSPQATVQQISQPANIQPGFTLLIDNKLELIILEMSKFFEFNLAKSRIFTHIWQDWTSINAAKSRIFTHIWRDWSGQETAGRLCSCRSEKTWHLSAQVCGWQLAKFDEIVCGCHSLNSRNS